MITNHPGVVRHNLPRIGKLGGGVSQPGVRVAVVSDGPLIHARGLVKRFGDLTAVDGIDVDVHHGEAFGFLGPNGAGKSSTMRMVGCVSVPTAGTLRILG